MNWSRMYLLRKFEKYVSENENCEFLLDDVKRYIWKNDIDESINHYKKMGHKHCFVCIPYKLINGNYNKLYKECYNDIKNHYENQGYSTQIKERKVQGLVDGHCHEIKVSWFNKNVDPNLDNIKEDLKKDLKNRFIVFKDSDIENLTKEELLIFYKMPSLRWGKYWKEMMNEKVK